MLSRINAIQNFFRQRQSETLNVALKKMAPEIWAILDYYSGTPECPKYDECPNKKKGLWFVP